MCLETTPVVRECIFFIIKIRKRVNYQAFVFLRAQFVIFSYILETHQLVYTEKKLDYMLKDIQYP